MLVISVFLLNLPGGNYPIHYRDECYRPLYRSFYIWTTDSWLKYSHKQNSYRPLYRSFYIVAKGWEAEKIDVIDLYIGLSTTRFSISFSLIYHIMTYFYLLFNIFPQNHQKSPSTSKSPYPIFLDFKLFFQSSIFLQRSTDFFTVMPRQFFLLHHQNTLLLLPSLYIPLSF